MSSPDSSSRTASLSPAPRREEDRSYTAVPTPSLLDRDTTGHTAYSQPGIARLDAIPRCRSSRKSHCVNRRQTKEQRGRRVRLRPARISRTEHRTRLARKPATQPCASSDQENRRRVTCLPGRRSSHSTAIAAQTTTARMTSPSSEPLSWWLTPPGIVRDMSTHGEPGSLTRMPTLSPGSAAVM